MTIPDMTAKEFAAQLNPGLRTIRTAQPKPLNGLRGMGKRLGCSAQQLEQIEKGVDLLSLYRLMRFCMVTKTKPGVLLGFLGVSESISYPWQTVQAPVLYDNLRLALKQRSDDLRMKQRTLAELTGMSGRQLRYYESGEQKLRTHQYFKIASALSLSPDEATLMLTGAARYVRRKPEEAVPVAETAPVLRATAA